VDVQTLEPARTSLRQEGFRWFVTVDDAFQAMLEAIGSAERSIRFETYIYRDSPIGVQVRDSLTHAVRRGVSVQVLLDALGSISLQESFWDEFVAAGGKFRWFNPIKLKRLGFRNHRKSLIVDERIAFVGGFNIAPEYQGDGLTKGWHDLGMQVSGVLTGELTASFDQHFALADYKHRRLARYRRSAVERVAETSHGQLLTNAPGRGPHYMKTAILRDIHSARAMDIISAYFLPPRQLRRGMMRAARQGRPVRLILAGKSDVLLSQLAARYTYTGLLRAGVQIFEYEPQILHTKMFVFDDVFYVGSANLDKRSLLVNYELLVRIKDRELAEEGREIFARTLGHCRRVDLAQWRASRTLWSKLKEQWAFFILSKLDPFLTRLQLEVLQRESLASRGGSLNWS
jgi:cardiolipin synthase